MIGPQYTHGGIASLIADQGRFGDSTMVHMNPEEVAALSEMGQMTINPETGFPEAFGLKDILKLGVGGLAAFLSGGNPWLTGLATGAFTGITDKSLKSGLVSGALAGLGAGAFGAGKEAIASKALRSTAEAGGSLASQAGGALSSASLADKLRTAAPAALDFLSDEKKIAFLYPQLGNLAQAGSIEDQEDVYGDLLSQSRRKFRSQFGNRPFASLYAQRRGFAEGGPTGDRYDDQSDLDGRDLPDGGGDGETPGGGGGDRTPYIGQGDRSLAGIPVGFTPGFMPELSYFTQGDPATANQFLDPYLAGQIPGVGQNPFDTSPVDQILDPQSMVRGIQSRFGGAQDIGPLAYDQFGPVAPTGGERPSGIPQYNWQMNDYFDDWMRLREQQEAGAGAGQPPVQPPTEAPVTPPVGPEILLPPIGGVVTPEGPQGPPVAPPVQPPVQPVAPTPDPVAPPSPGINPDTGETFTPNEIDDYNRGVEEAVAAQMEKSYKAVETYAPTLLTPAPYGESPDYDHGQIATGVADALGDDDLDAARLLEAILNPSTSDKGDAESMGTLAESFIGKELTDSDRAFLAGSLGTTGEVDDATLTALYLKNHGPSKYRLLQPQGGGRVMVNDPRRMMTGFAGSPDMRFFTNVEDAVDFLNDRWGDYEWDQGQYLYKGEGSAFAGGGVIPEAAAGIPALAQTEGGVRGPGSGMSDDVPATNGGGEPIALSSGEFIIPADVVSMLGDGDTDSGVERLYEMMARVRTEKTGTPNEAPPINVSGALPR